MAQSSNARFQVSAKGMREMNEGRPAWHLVKELIQNVWDEAPVATTCEVRMERINTRSVRFEVEDDGPGFSNIEDAYTLLRPTGKRLDPSKRGRFNLGEKEFISVARDAEVETVGHTVSFPRGGGREVRRNNRTSGTCITATMPWTNSDIEGLIVMLKHFRPTDCALKVNGKDIVQPKALRTFDAVLPSVLQSGPGEPLRPTRRKCEVHILPGSDEGTWLYEMGIPVQELDMPFSVDVLQKMPLSPQRDGVGNAYLKEITALVLNNTHDLIDEEQATAQWTHLGMSHKAVSPEAVRTVLRNRYGDKAVLWSSNTDSNKRAIEDGFVLIPRGSMTAEEREHAIEHAGIKTAHDSHGKRFAPSHPAENTPNRLKFAEFAYQLAKQAGFKDLKVQFIESPKSTVSAQCTIGSESPTLTVVVDKFTEDWFGIRGPSQIALVLHELGHARTYGPALAHSELWGDAVAETAAAIIARHMGIS